MNDLIHTTKTATEEDPDTGVEIRPSWYDNREEVAKTESLREYNPIDDELDATFDALNEAGFDTVEGFACCGTCASYEGREDRPLAFYNVQALQRLGRSTGRPTGMYVGFSGGGDTSAEAAGAAIVDAASAAGLATTWDGDTNVAVWIGEEELDEEDR